ncbi:La-related protein 6 [Hordeum vulgare]|nr:La-related protein 6 [Hordeum vulgare]
MASPSYVVEVGAIRADHSIPEEHLIEAGEDVDYAAMSTGSSVRVQRFIYLMRADYDIKVINIDGFTRAVSQVKWSTENASGSTVVDLFKGPVADILYLAVMDM